MNAVLHRFIFALLMVLAMVAPLLYSANNFDRWLTAAAMDAQLFKAAKEQETEWMPRLKQNFPAPELSPLAYLAAFVGRQGGIKILAEKNAEDQLPIASVSKLMTALISLENYNPEEKVLITGKLIDFLGKDGSKRFRSETEFKIKDLLYAMLIESNNDAAAALMLGKGQNEFMNKMNERAKGLDMLSTNFANPVGLDPENIRDELNYSSANDLLALVLEIKKNYPEIFAVTALPEYSVHTAAGHYNHTAESTNKFLRENKLVCAGKPLKILGAKTGYTDLARKNLVLLTESPANEGYLINIVLGSDDNFEDMKKLVGWVCQAYDWMPALTEENLR